VQRILEGTLRGGQRRAREHTLQQHARVVRPEHALQAEHFERE
jgi:hypothetical protein